MFLSIRYVCLILFSVPTLAACIFSPKPLSITENALTVNIGPLNLPRHSHSHDHNPTLTFNTFTIPRNGWITGFVPGMRYANGSEAPKQLLHHIVIAENGHRNYLCGYLPRMRFLIASGSEMTSAQIPAGYGIPVSAGKRLTVIGMFHNPLHEAQRNVYFHGRLLFTPDDGAQRLSPVLPVWVDVDSTCPEHGYMIGARKHDVRTREFRFPFAGRLLSAGGHLHDQADHLRLSNHETGKVFVNFVPQYAPGKRIHAIAPVTLAPPVEVDTKTKYVLEAVYTNTLDREIDAMGIAVLLVAPARLSEEQADK